MSIEVVKDATTGHLMSGKFTSECEVQSFLSFFFFSSFQYCVRKFVINVLVLVQHSRWQSWCTSSTLQGPTRRLLYHGMWFLVYVYCSFSHGFGVYLFLVANIYSLETNITCRLWTCWGQACGMYGTITLTRKFS